MTDQSPTFSKQTFRSRAVATLLAASLLAGCNSGPSDPVEAAQQSLLEGEPRTALLHISKALEAQPDNGAVRLLASEIAMILSNPDRAITELKAIDGASEYAAEAKERLGEAYLALGNLRMATQTLEDMPLETARAYRVAIGLDYAQGENGQAATKLDRALAKFPEDLQLQTMDAQRQFYGGQTRKALARLDPILKVEPYVAEAHLLAGQIHLADRSLDMAAQCFENVIAVRPSHQTAMLAMAAISRDRGDTKASAEWVQKAANAGPAHPVALYFTAQMAFDAGDIDRAHELMQGMPRGFGGVPQVQRLEGFIASVRGQHQTAITALERYFARSEGDLRARRVLAENYAAAGELEDAWRTISPVVDQPQADGPSLLLAAELAERTGRGDVAKIRNTIARQSSRTAVAEQLLEAGQAIRGGDWKTADSILSPLAAGSGSNDPVVLNNAASVKSKLGQHDKAIPLARKAHQLAPQSPEIMDTLGWSLWQSGSSREEARKLLTRARELAPRNREIADHWATAHAER